VEQIPWRAGVRWTQLSLSHAAAKGRLHGLDMLKLLSRHATLSRKGPRYAKDDLPSGRLRLKAELPPNAVRYHRPQPIRDLAHALPDLRS